VVISVSLNFPYPARVTLGEAKQVGPAPKCQGVLSWRGPKEVCVALFAAALKLLWGGTETPQGRRSRSRTTPSRRAPVWLRSVIPSRGRESGRKIPQCTVVTLSISAAEVRFNRSLLWSYKASARGRLSAGTIALFQAQERHAGRFQRRVGLCSRLDSMFDHRSDLDLGLVSLAGCLTFRRRKHDRCPPSGSIGRRDCSQPR
jgi:hypothetical protein